MPKDSVLSASMGIHTVNPLMSQPCNSWIKTSSSDDPAYQASQTLAGTPAVTQLNSSRASSPTSLIKQLWLKINEKIRCSKSVRPNTVIYIVYITRTDFEHLLSQLFRVRVVLWRRTFYKKKLGHKKGSIFKIGEQSL